MEKEICPECPWMQEIEEPAIYKLLEYLSLQDSGCPLGRHELTSNEWQMLGIIKSERECMAAEEAKEKHGTGN